MVVEIEQGRMDGTAADDGGAGAGAEEQGAPALRRIPNGDGGFLISTKVRRCARSTLHALFALSVVFPVGNGPERRGPGGAVHVST